MFGLFKWKRCNKLPDELIGYVSVARWFNHMVNIAYSGRTVNLPGDPLQLVDQFLCDIEMDSTPLELVIATDGRAPVRVAAAIKSGLTKHLKSESALIAMLADREELIRRIATCSLVLFGTVKALNAVIGTKDTSRRLRLFAAQKLVKFGEEAAPAIPALFAALRDPWFHPTSGYHFANAVASTGEIGKSHLIQALQYGSLREKWDVAVVLQEHNLAPEHSNLINDILADD